MTPAQVAEAVFDSHRFVKRLTDAGMEEGLAEVLAEEHMGPWIRNVASKADVAVLREGLEHTRTTMRQDVAMLRKDLEDTRTAMREDLERTEANIRRDAATKTEVAMVRKDLEDLRRNAATKADVANAVAAAERRLMVAIIGVAGVLFAALRLSQ